MRPEKLFISTIAEDDAALASQYSLGLEIAEYCTAWNMDEYFAQTDAVVREKMKHTEHFVFHACFNELYPSAIDKRAVQLAYDRYLQAADLSYNTYGIRKMVVHSGFVPLIYYPEWFVERSIEFWKNLLSKLPEDMTLCLENVMENAPDMLMDIVKNVNDPRFKLCFDVGHASAVQQEDGTMDWLKKASPWISHFHIHNNPGGRDLHQPLGDGRIDMKAFLREAERLCPEATFTIENARAEQSVRFLIENGLLKLKA